MSRIFVSYKSEDANLVRGVAERLVASGLDLWFAEKDIRVEDFPETEEEVTRRLEAAISEVDGAIVFTNNRWSRADWCRFEIRRLLDRIREPARLLEIFIPREPGPHREFPALAGLPGLIFPGDPLRPSPEQLDELTGATLAHFGRAPGAPTSGWRMNAPLRLPRFGLSVDLGPFTRNLRYTRILQRRHRIDSRTLVCTAELEGQLVTLDLYVWPFSTPAQELSISQDGAADDREVYSRYRRFAERWLAQLSDERGHRCESRGLHLFFSGGHSHLALSYVTDVRAAGERTWERRYAITTAGADRAERGEAGLVFGVHLRGSADEQLRGFCRLAPLFDAVATTARYLPTRGAGSFVLHLPIALARAAWVAGALVALAQPASTTWPRPLVAAIALVFGFGLGDLAQFVCSSLYRRLLWTWQPIDDDAAPRTAYERFSTELVFWLFSLPAQAIAYVARCLGSAPRPSIAGRLWGLAALTCFALTLPIPGLPFAQFVSPVAVATGSVLGLTLALIGGRLYVEMKRARVSAR